MILIQKKTIVIKYIRYTLKIFFVTADIAKPMQSPPHPYYCTSIPHNILKEGRHFNDQQFTVDALLAKKFMLAFIHPKKQCCHKFIKHYLSFSHSIKPLICQKYMQKAIFTSRYFFAKRFILFPFSISIIYLQRLHLLVIIKQIKKDYFKSFLPGFKPVL